MFIENKNILLWIDNDIDPSIKEDYKYWSPIGMVGIKVIWLTSLEEFKGWITENGLPEGICFNYNLGDSGCSIEGFWDIETKARIPKVIFPPENGLSCIRWLIEYCKKLNKDLPRYNTHSDNVKANILMLATLQRYRNYRKKIKNGKVISLFDDMKILKNLN